MEGKAKEIIEKLVLNGGEVVSLEQYNKRLSICRSNKCGRFGKVKQLGVVWEEGCQACGCPLATKARMKKVTNYFLSKILSTEIVECELGFWEETDKFLKTNNND